MFGRWSGGGDRDGEEGKNVYRKKAYNKGVNF